MKHVLKNDSLTVTVESKGAELVSILDRKGTEYLWSGDPKYWGRQSPILFPFVGRLKNFKYTYRGKEYPSQAHGFARDCEFEVISRTGTEIWFELKDNEETYAVYPFHFSLEIGYRLSGNKIYVAWKVKNPDETETLYFSIGGHPGFCCPFGEGEGKEGYFIEMDVKDKATYYFANFDTGLAIDKKHELLLEDGRCEITEGFFDESAYIFEDHQISEISLLTPSKKRYVRVKFDMPIVAIWSHEKIKSPFVCIEPWCGRCDGEWFEGTLEERDWGNVLEAGEVFEKEYSIEIGEN